MYIRCTTDMSIIQNSHPLIKNFWNEIPFFDIVYNACNNIGQWADVKLQGINTLRGGATVSIR